MEALMLENWLSSSTRCKADGVLQYSGQSYSLFLQGITFNPSRLVVPTKKAHILLEHAAREGKQHEMQEVKCSFYPCEVQTFGLHIKLDTGACFSLKYIPHIPLTLMPHTHTHTHPHTQILFRSYFSEGKNVNSEPVLRALLEEVGLDPDKALALLQDKEAVQHFEEGIREALRKGRCRNLSGFDYRMSSGNVSTFVSRYFCCSPL